MANIYAFRDNLRRSATHMTREHERGPHSQSEHEFGMESTFQYDIPVRRIRSRHGLFEGLGQLDKRSWGGSGSAGSRKPSSIRSKEITHVGCCALKSDVKMGRVASYPPCLSAHCTSMWSWPISAYLAIPDLP